MSQTELKEFVVIKNVNRDELLLDLSNDGVTNIIFMGNPGTGKSTLLNTIIGDPVFRSGVSYGSGLTTNYDTFHKLGICFGDTPGLDDVITRERAGREINKALKNNGIFKLYFILTTESGRGRPSDLATVKTILDCFDEDLVDKIKYTIIYNKVDVDEDMEEIITNNIPAFDSLKIKPSDFYCVPRMQSLKGKDVVGEMTSDYFNSIKYGNKCEIVKEKVHKIDVSSWDQYQKELETENKMLKEKITKLEQEFEEFKKTIRDDFMRDPDKIKTTLGLKYSISSKHKVHSTSCHYYINNKSRMRICKDYNVDDLCKFCYIPTN